MPHGLAKITRAGCCYCQHDMYAELRWKWHHDKWLRLMYTLHGPNMDTQARVGWCNSILTAQHNHMCPTVWPKLHVLDIVATSMTYMQNWGGSGIMISGWGWCAPCMDPTWIYKQELGDAIPSLRLNTPIWAPRFGQNHTCWKSMWTAWHKCRVEG